MRIACMHRCIYLLAAWALAGCEVDFNRMFEQPRFDAYEPSAYFPNGSVMRHPPEGTVPRSRLVVAPEVGAGMRDGVLVDRVPVPVTRELVLRGQNRYEIFCATCHGSTGTGNTQVAENMRLRPPTPLVLPPVREYPAGRIFRVISEGYGLMRAYDAELSLPDRWAVVAYVQALQLSQQIALDALPPIMLTEAMTWLQ